MKLVPRTPSFFLPGYNSTTRCLLPSVASSKFQMRRWIQSLPRPPRCCLRFGTLRGRQCIAGLSRLHYPISLSFSLLLGQAPPPPEGVYRDLRKERKFLAKIHDECLEVTGKYLVAVNK